MTDKVSKESEMGELSVGTGFEVTEGLPCLLSLLERSQGYGYGSGCG